MGSSKESCRFVEVRRLEQGLMGVEYWVWVLMLGMEEKKEASAALKFKKIRKRASRNSKLQICCVQVTLHGVSQENSVNQSVSADKCCVGPVM